MRKVEGLTLVEIARMHRPSFQILRDLAIAEYALTVSTATDLPLDPEEGHFCELAAVRLPVSAAMAHWEVGNGNGDLVDLLEIIYSLHISDVGLASDDIGDRNGQAVKGGLLHNESLLEGAGIEGNDGTHPLVTGSTHDDGLEAAAGLAHGNGTGRIDRSVVFTGRVGTLGLEPIKLCKYLQSVGRL